MISHGPLNESPAILSADLSLGPPHLAYRLYCAVSTVEKIGVGIATSLPMAVKVHIKEITSHGREVARTHGLLTRRTDTPVSPGGISRLFPS